MTTTEYHITLPWPPKELSPNARTHWGAKSSKAKAYRAGAHWAALAAGCRAIDADSLTVEITFHPPDRRRRDLDNMLAAIKSGLDGIADAAGVDDSLWHIGIARGEVVEGGAVSILVLARSRGKIFPTGEQTGNWQSLGQIAKRLAMNAEATK